MPAPEKPEESGSSPRPPLPEGPLSFFRRKDADERPQPAPGLAAGKVVGDFRLVSLIGQGGMGQVWEAEQLSLRRRVAVKFVRPERVTERQLELFAREARAGGRLSHPGLVTVFGHGESEGLAWIAMEFVGGAWTLKDFLDEVARSPEPPQGYDRAVARLVAEIAEAMQAAHEEGVIHRDLKPQNVLITAEDLPKVTDFGLARITDESAMSQTGDIAGTYLYMSPEQVAARRAGLDHRTDVFSLGIVLYELLALRRPFEGDTTQQVAEQILYRDPPDPRTIRSRVPRDLAVIANHALEKERDQRYQAMKELAADLRRTLAHEPIHATPPTWLDRAVKWARRNPGKSSGAAIVAVTFTVIALLLLANVRTNRALALKTTEAEASATEARNQARIARTNAEHAVSEEALAKKNEHIARERADDVLRLSALQKLEDLTNEADRLWPAHPPNIARYEGWLARAAALVAELPAHEEKLAELRSRSVPWTAEEQARQRAEHPRLGELEGLQRELEYRTRFRAVLESGNPGAEPTAAELGVDLASLPTSVSELNGLVWPLIDPDRKHFGAERKGLALARRAQELTAGLAAAERVGIRHVLAWALFANGHFDEALAEEEQALAEAAAHERQAFEGHVERLRKAIEAAIDPQQEAQRQQHRTKVEARIAELEAELSGRAELAFVDAQDKWWHNQLEKLVQGLTAFADERTGLFSSGISQEHGWGIKKRLASALELRRAFAPDSPEARAWSAALLAIRGEYPGLTLTPQLGLLPLGPDPLSGLWEFAHLETGEPAVRNADGKLTLREASGLVFVLLPGGTFQMGAQRHDPGGPNHDPSALDIESPVHAVTLSAFFLSKYEMTQGQWERFAGRNPSNIEPGIAWGGQRASRANPVEQVDWFECTEVMDRLGLSLPSEAQWEYGARGGTHTVWWTGNERDSLVGAVNLADRAAQRDDQHWADIDDWPELDDGHVVHARVDAFLPNAFGLHNVHGNVWEWCLDTYDANFYAAAVTRDPLVPAVGSSTRVVRGGAFDSRASLARSAARFFSAPSIPGYYLGLRPARTIAP